MQKNKLNLTQDHSKKQFLEYKCPLCKDVGAIIYKVTDNFGKVHDYADPCDCRNGKIKECRLLFADIPNEFKDLTIDSFKTDIYKKNGFEANRAKNMCINYINDFTKYKEIGKGLYLYSNTKGSGKTKMAVSIANAIINYKNTAAKFTTAIRIIEEIKRTFYDDEADKNIIRDLQRIDVLVIDDLGTERHKDFVNEQFYSILNERLISKRVTIFTSNCAVEDLNIDERIVNRIQQMAIPIKFPEESIRLDLAIEENQVIIAELLKT